jgi:Tol biopolymer transport system component
MTPERREQVARVYQSALEQAPASRAAFMADACRDDSALRREVESLLEQDQAAVLLDQPVDLAAAAVLETDAKPNDYLGPYRVEGLVGESSLSPDGKWLVARTTPGPDPLLIALDTGRLWPLGHSEFSEVNAEISPDGRWLAYQSNTSGQHEIYVSPFPNASEGRWLVSSGGAVQPLWRRDERELFFRALDGAILSVSVSDGATWSASAPVKVMDASYVLFVGGQVNNPRPYDVSLDGRRFLMIKRGADERREAASRYVVVENGFKELKQRVAVP